MANPILIHILGNLHKLKETRRVIKALLKNKRIRNGYEMYLRRETIIKSDRTILEYTEPKHSSAAFNSFKHLEVFIDREIDQLMEIDAAGVVSFLSLKERLVDLKKSTETFFALGSIRDEYTKFLIYKGMTNPTAKKWANADSAWSTWFDSMEHFGEFLTRNPGLIESDGAVPTLAEEE